MTPNDFICFVLFTVQLKDEKQHPQHCGTFSCCAREDYRLLTWDQVLSQVLFVTFFNSGKVF